MPAVAALALSLAAAACWIWWPAEAALGDPSPPDLWRIALDPTEPDARRRWAAVKLRRIECGRSSQLASVMVDAAPELRLALDALASARR